MAEYKYTPADFKSDQIVKWCPGCGDHAILNAVQRAMPEVADALDIPHNKFTFVSGIGCSSRFIYYMKTYGFHTIHGRANAIATGIKVANPDLSVWVCTSLSGTVLSLIFAYYIYRRNPLSNFLKFVLFLPSVLPGILLAVMYKKFVGVGIPAYMNFLFETTISDIFNAGSGGGRINLITLFTVWISFGPQVLVYTGAMDRVDPSMLEAGRIDGANSIQEFFRIIFPNISSTVSTFLIIGVASIFTNQNNLISFLSFDATFAESTIGYYLYKRVYSDFTGKSGFCYAAFLGLLCTLIVIPLAFGARKLFDRGED